MDKTIHPYQQRVIDIIESKISYTDLRMAQESVNNFGYHRILRQDMRILTDLKNAVSEFVLDPKKSVYEELSDKLLKYVQDLKTDDESVKFKLEYFSEQIKNPKNLESEISIL